MIQQSNVRTYKRGYGYDIAFDAGTQVLIPSSELGEKVNSYGVNISLSGHANNRKKIS